MVRSYCRVKIEIIGVAENKMQAVRDLVIKINDYILVEGPSSTMRTDRFFGRKRCTIKITDHNIKDGTLESILRMARGSVGKTPMIHIMKKLNTYIEDKGK